MATKIDPRAQASGFSTKLKVFLDSNVLIRNPNRLAEWLVDRGEPIQSTSVRDWEAGRSLPRARYIGHLEQLLGAPWSYLDDPKTAWPRPLDDAALLDLIRILPAEVTEESTSELVGDTGRFIAILGLVAGVVMIVIGSSNWPRQSEAVMLGSFLVWAATQWLLMRAAIVSALRMWEVERDARRT